MTVAGSFQISYEFRICRNHGCQNQFKGSLRRGKLHMLGANLSSHASRQDSLCISLSAYGYRPLHRAPYRSSVFKCHSSLVPWNAFQMCTVEPTMMVLTRSYNAVQGSPFVVKIITALGIIVFAMWGLGPLLRKGRNLFLHKNDGSWKKSGTYHVMMSYLRPFLLWASVILLCRAFDSVIPPSEAVRIVKQRLLNFVRSLSTVLASAYCLSSVIQQTQKFFMETNDASDTRKMGFHFAGKAVYSAVWVAAVSLFMELLGFSTQRWLTAGGLGTVLLTLAGREIFTNFLSSAMIHATRPFVVNEWIQTKIEGYEVSGTVEHVGWWSPTIIRGEDREAVHIPNHKFTMNVVRNLSQKTHWRIKTHLAISHLDVSKINNIVADMRKVLAKNPQVEQQRLHRRVFLDRINPENQALLILVSCFIKTSHFEEYLCVKEGIVLDLLRVISHHRARLATPIRTVQKVYDDLNLENVPFADTIITSAAAAATAFNRPLLLIEPPHKINGGDDKAPKSTKDNATVVDAKPVVPKSSKVPNPKSEKVRASSKGQESSDKKVESKSEKSDMEENIVLGVALDGSKRMLPIEEVVAESGSSGDTNNNGEKDGSKDVWQNEVIH